MKDLIGVRLAAGGRVLFDATDVSVHDFDTPAPRIAFATNPAGAEAELNAISSAAATAFMLCRPFPGRRRPCSSASIPSAGIGILVEAATREQETVYARHEKHVGFLTGARPRSPRHFLQVAADEDIANWPDRRIWDELRVRLATDDGWQVTEGPVLNRNITELRSFVVEPHAARPAHARRRRRAYRAADRREGS